MNTQSNVSSIPSTLANAPATLSGEVANEALVAAGRAREAANASIQDTRKQIARMRPAILYSNVRLLAARWGAPDWMIALIVSCSVAFVISLFLIIGFRVGSAFLCAELFMCIAGLGGVVFWLFHDRGGENDTNRVEVRTAQFAKLEELRRTLSRRAQEEADVVTTTQERIAAIQQSLKSEASKHQLETDRLLSIDPGRLYPDEFERFVAAIFAHLGYTVEVAGQSGDQGVDVIACKGNLRLAIQAKRYIGSVGNGAVQEVYAGMAHRKCHKCLVVSSGEFTSGAIALAASTGCILIGAARIEALIRAEIIT